MLERGNSLTEEDYLIQTKERVWTINPWDLKNETERVLWHRFINQEGRITPRNIWLLQAQKNKVYEVAVRVGKTKKLSVDAQNNSQVGEITHVKIRFNTDIDHQFTADRYDKQVLLDPICWTAETRPVVQAILNQIRNEEPPMPAGSVFLYEGKHYVLLRGVTKSFNYGKRKEHFAVLGKEKGRGGFGVVSNVDGVLKIEEGQLIVEPRAKLGISDKAKAKLPLVLKEQSPKKPDEIGREATKEVAEAERHALTLAGVQVKPRRDYGTAQHLFIEKAQGKPLSKWLYDRGKKKPITFAQAIEWCEQIAIAYQEMVEQRGLMHLDLKPDNIKMKARPGLPPQATIVDFGLAHTIDRPPSGWVGSWDYAAPEVYENPRGNRVTQQSDFYSLGIIFAEILGRKTHRPSPRMKIGEDPAAFREAVHQAAYEVAMRGELVNHQIELFAGVSGVVKKYTQAIDNFIYNMISPDPCWRPTSSEAIRNFFHNINEKLKAESQGEKKGPDKGKEREKVIERKAGSTDRDAISALEQEEKEVESRKSSKSTKGKEPAIEEKSNEQDSASALSQKEKAENAFVQGLIGQIIALDGAVTTRLGFGGSDRYIWNQGQLTLYTLPRGAAEMIGFIDAYYDKKLSFQDLMDKGLKAAKLGLGRSHLFFWQDKATKTFYENISAGFQQQIEAERPQKTGP